MRTHPHVSLTTARQQACGRLAKTYAFLTVWCGYGLSYLPLLSILNVSFAIVGESILYVISPNVPSSSSVAETCNHNYQLHYSLSLFR